MAVDIGYISDFLNRSGVEGPRVCIGYIPCWIAGTGRVRSANYTGVAGQDPSRYEAMGASGVTIATGVDLGQTDAGTLRGYGVPAALCDALQSYFGLRRAAAIKQLSKMPLRIRPADAEALDHAVHAGYLARYVLPVYNRNSCVPFDDLPRQAQAVIFSVCYQKGCGGVRKDWPKLWGFLTTQRWADASEELRHGFKQYVLRRRIEGELLRELG